MGFFVAIGRASACAFVMLCGLGCASPPSVGPLLRIVDATLQAERQHLDDDAALLANWYTQQRESMRSGFDADLTERADLDAEWVRTHVVVYVAARESLLESAMAHRSALAVRRANLDAASVAQQRAIGLIEQQDQLFADVPDLRRLWLSVSQQERIDDE